MKFGAVVKQKMASAVSGCLSINTVSYERPLRTKGSGVRIPSGAPINQGVRLIAWLLFLFSKGIAGVAVGIDHAAVFTVPEMNFHLGLQRAPRRLW